jgi:hypothetical protein
VDVDGGWFDECHNFHTMILTRLVAFCLVAQVELVGRGKGLGEGYSKDYFEVLDDQEFIAMNRPYLMLQRAPGRQ